MAVTSEQIENYDWNEPVSKNPEVAYYALEACIERNFPEQSQFDGAFMNGLPPKMEILRHKTNGEMPKAFIDRNTEQVGVGIQGGSVIWSIGNFTLADLVSAWNFEQNEDETDDDDADDKDDAIALESELDKGVASYDDAAMLQRVHTLGTKEHEDAVLEETRQKIAEVCDSIKELLLEKNRKYGNSALNPCRIFAKSDRLEQIKVRIDDKLNRIRNEQSDEDEDVVKDLIGYLVLYQVAKMEGK